MNLTVRSARRLLVLFVLFSACGAISGCGLIQRAGIKFLYREAALPPQQILRDIHYGPSAKQTLNLFLPAASNFPVMVFIHGGGWTDGDKDLRVGGADVYNNIGRFYAARGIGVAVISYRLIPKVTWRDQLADAALATAWIHAHIASHGGDSQRIFLSGHSAGSQIAARLALDEHWLSAAGVPVGDIRGVIAASGAGYDLADQETYRLGHEKKYFAKRFATGPDWPKEASPVSFAHAGAPPFLIISAQGEPAAIRRQSQRLVEVLQQDKIPHQVLIVPGESHPRMVLVLSRQDKVAAPAIINFIERSKRDRP